MEVTTRQHQDYPEWPYCCSLPGARVVTFSEGDLYCVGGCVFIYIKSLGGVYNTRTKLNPGAAL